MRKLNLLNRILMFSLTAAVLFAFGKCTGAKEATNSVKNLEEEWNGIASVAIVYPVTPPNELAIHSCWHTQFIWREIEDGERWYCGMENEEFSKISRNYYETPAYNKCIDSLCEQPELLLKCLMENDTTNHWGRTEEECVLSTKRSS